jgi:type II secretory pathway pseudopilin PulG
MTVFRRAAWRKGNAAARAAGARPLSQRSVRHAFTVMESIIAIALLLVVAGLLAELGMVTLAEKQRNSGRQQAQETAMNVLEAARAGAWETLTPEWAKAQRLPEALATDLEKAQLLVQIEPEPARPHTKRITVEVRWQQDGKPVRPVKLVSLLSARSAARPGGKL